METKHAFARFSGLARFCSSGSVHTSRCKHRCAAPPCVPVCCAFGDFFFSRLLRARRRPYDLLALYYFPWLRVHASLRSPFALYVLYLGFFNILTPCRSPCGHSPAPPTSSPTPPTSKRSPTSAKPNTMTSGVSIPRLFFTSMRTTRLWVNGPMSWAPSPIQSSIQLTHALTTISPSRFSCAPSSPLRRCSANTLASSSWRLIVSRRLFFA